MHSIHDISKRETLVRQEFLEFAFLHNSSGGRVIDEEVRPQSKEALDIKQ